MMFESLQPHRMYFPSVHRPEAATARPTLTSPVKHSNRSQQYRTSLVTGNQQRYGKGVGSGIKAWDGRIYFPQSNSCSPNTISFNNITLNTPDSSCLALGATHLHNSKVDCSKLEKAAFMEPVRSEQHLWCLVNLTNSQIDKLASSWSGGSSVLRDDNISKVLGSNP